MPTPCLPPEGQRRRSGAFAWLGIKTCGAACLVAAAAAVMTGCGTPDRPGPAAAPRIDTRAVPMRDAGSPLPEGWQHGAFMEVFVRSYADSDGDGIGAKYRCEGRRVAGGTQVLG